MTQPFTDALSWVPKSRALGASLTRAHDLARAQGHATVTLEHLLSALIEDPDASAVLLASNVDLLKLNSAANAHLQQLLPGSGAAPEVAAPVLTILEYAVAAARQSKRSEVNGAIVLAAMVGEGNSVAARMLQAQGLTFEGAVQALKRTSSQPARPTASAAPPTASTPPVPPPSAANAVAPAAAVAPPISMPGEDPVTTARRRIEAMRTGQPLPQPAPAPAAPLAAAPAQAPLAPPPPAEQPVVVPPAPATSEAQSGNWAPPPLPAQSAPPVRPPRMPPPIPPLASPPPRASGPAAGAAQATAPWTDPNASPSRPEPASATVIPFPANRAGMPIDPARLADRLPKLLKIGVPTTVEVRIARSAVHATAATLGAAPEAALTRALTVRLKAPAGGIHIETAAPETQWFDVRNTGRDDEEVRWRWILTPNATGTHPLQLVIGMRTLASDGVMLETALPEYQAPIRVVRPFASMLISASVLAGAAACGALLMFLASGGLSGILRAFG